MALPTKHEKETGLSQRWTNPFEQMEQWFQESFPERWMHPFRRSWMETPTFESMFEGKMMKVDVVDREKEILVRAELPGVKKDDIDITVDDQQVTIKATTSHEEKEEEGEYYRHEISRGEYHRSFALPTKVNIDKVKTTFKDGVMELTLPKTEPSKRRKIKVQ